MPAQPSFPLALGLKRDFEKQGNKSIFRASSPLSVLSLSESRSNMEARSINVNGDKIFLMPQKLIQKERHIIAMLILALI